MRKLTILMSVLLSAGIFCACSKDDNDGEGSAFSGLINGLYAAECYAPNFSVGDTNVLFIQDENGKVDTCGISSPYCGTKGPITTTGPDNIAFEDYPFMTSGRGSKEGVRFKYSVCRRGSAGGRHYSGVSIDGYGNEIWIESNGETLKKSISRSTVELGYKRAREMAVVKGPKALSIPGAGSYLRPIFLRLGICTAE